MNSITESEVWVPIPGYTGYEISSSGAVRSFWRRIGKPGSTFDTWAWVITDRPKLLKHSINRDGYHQVRLQIQHGTQKLITVHTLILKSFVGPRPSRRHDGCHIDDNKDRNELSNLEWGTREHNQHTRFLNKGGYKLSKHDIPKIRALFGTGISQVDIGARFGVTQGLISRIKNLKQWDYV